jgi:hypothetical protein
LLRLPGDVFFSGHLTSSRPTQQICHAHHRLQLILIELCGGSLLDIRDRLCLRQYRRKIRSSILNFAIAAFIANPLDEILPGFFELLDLFAVSLHEARFDLVLSSMRAIHIDVLQVSRLVRSKGYLSLGFSNV